MMFTDHQRTHPSDHIEIDDPVWIDEAYAETARALSITAEQAREEFPPAVVVGVIESMCGYGRETAEKVIDMWGLMSSRAYQARPPRCKPPWETMTFDTESEPESWDHVGIARKLGRVFAVEAAQAAANVDRSAIAAKVTKDRRAVDKRTPDAGADDPKVKRLVVKAALDAHRAEITGEAAAQRRRRAEPIEREP